MLYKLCSRRKEVKVLLHNKKSTVPAVDFSFAISARVAYKNGACALWHRRRIYQRSLMIWVISPVSEQ